MSTTEDIHEAAVQDARERVSFLRWALQSHRLAETTRGAYWQRLDDEYVHQLEQATAALEKWESLQPKPPA